MGKIFPFITVNMILSKQKNSTDHISYFGDEDYERNMWVMVTSSSIFTDNQFLMSFLILFEKGPIKNRLLKHYPGQSQKAQLDRSNLKLLCQKICHWFNFVRNVAALLFNF